MNTERGLKSVESRSNETAQKFDSHAIPMPPEAECLLCHRSFTSDSMIRVPLFFVPGAHVLYAFAHYAHKNMYSLSLKSFIGPILAFFEIKGNAPVCLRCRRLAILSSIAIYLLFLIPLLALLLGYQPAGNPK